MRLLAAEGRARFSAALMSFSLWGPLNLACGLSGPLSFQVHASTGDGGGHQTAVETLVEPQCSGLLSAIGLRQNGFLILHRKSVHTHLLSTFCVQAVFWVLKILR